MGSWLGFHSNTGKKPQRNLMNISKMCVIILVTLVHQVTRKLERVIKHINRSFQHKWLSYYDGLVYSPSADGAYCLYCVLFSRDITKHGQLVRFPFKHWKKATEKFDEHFKNVRHNSGDISTSSHKKTGTGHQAHQICATMCKEFCLVITQEKQAVNVKIDSALEQRKKKNMQVLMTIVETVVLCGRQNVALRGHRDDESHEKESDKNSGNFRAFLQYRINGGDKVLEEHCATAPKNATYKSKTVQNELIDIIGDSIRQKIVSDIKQAGGFFSISADEVRDTANKEQLAVTLRFTDMSDKIREEFIAFLDVSESTTGENLSAELLRLVDDLGLDPNKIRSQCYDGAGNMAGKVNGVGARIQREYPKAVPFWCAAHQLNRCVVQSCVIPAVRNMMSDADEVVKFFEWSPAKELALLSKAETTLTDDITKTKLKELCRTRWVERHDAFRTFLDMFPAIVATLEDYASKPNTRVQGVASASSLHRTVTDFDFIITMIIVQKCLCYISGLSKSLQERSLDVGRAIQQVVVVKEALVETRSEVDEFHQQCFREAESIANDLEIPITKPRTCGRQTKRNNVPSETPEDYYRKSVTIPFLDHLISELNGRFTDLHERASVGLKLVPSMMESRVSASELEYFDADLPERSNLESELHQWFKMWNSKSEKPSTIVDALKSCSANFYPNIKTVLRICATFPITSCECERSISVLRLLKTYLRSTMGQNRLTSLALIYIHRDIPLNYRDIVVAFANRNPRRILLPNIMSECDM